MLHLHCCCIHILPFVLTVAMVLDCLASHILIVLSPEAVTNNSGFVGCQHNWSTLSVWPRSVPSLLCKCGQRHINMNEYRVRNSARIQEFFSQRFLSTNLQYSKLILVNISVYHTKLYGHASWTGPPKKVVMLHFSKSVNNKLTITLQSHKLYLQTWCYFKGETWSYLLCENHEFRLRDAGGTM